MKKVLFSIILLLVFSHPAFGQSGKGLYFDKEDIPGFRHRFASDPMFAGLRAKLENIDREAERRFMESEVRYNDHLYDIKRLSDFAQQMSFHYLFSGNHESADLAIKAVRTMMKFPTWDYFLEGDQVIGFQRAPAATIATSLTIELLGDLIDQKERKEWLRIMAKRGNEPCYLATYGMRYPEKVKGWRINPASTYFEHRPGDRDLDLSRWPYILDKINLKAIPASALAIGALAYQKYLGESGDTKRWIEQAIFSLQTFRDIFEKDGSYLEGISYAHYTSSHLLQGFIPVKRLLGIDLTDSINWPGYIEYLQEMTLPTAGDPYGIVNFSDAGRGALSSTAFWIAAKLYEGRAQWFGKNMAREHDYWSLLWYDPAIEVESAPKRPHLYKADLDWLIGRSGYAAGDLVVALRSGGPMNHEHADRNSIIVKCFGEQLVVDPYRPPYAFSDPSWIMRLTSGHSAVLIDGKGHQYVDGSEGTNPSKAWAHIVRTGERDGYLFWTSDATPAYRLAITDVKSITRTVVMLHEIPAVLLLDKVRKNAKPSRIQARFFGYNMDGKGKVLAEQNHFSIHRPGAILRGFCESNGEISFAAGKLPIPAERANMHPFVQVSTKDAKKESFLISVLLLERAPGGNGNAKIEWDEKEGCYRVEIRNGNKRLTCKVFDSGAIPEFAIE